MPKSNPTDNLLATIETFICHMYGFRLSTSVNEARYVLFRTTHKFSSNNQIPCFQKNKIEGSVLPPRKRELGLDFLGGYLI